MEAFPLSECLLARTVRFSASHFLHNPLWSEEQNRLVFGRVGQNHWHLWHLTVWVTQNPIADTGLIADLPLLDRQLKEQVLDRCHGACLNEVIPLPVPQVISTETLARYFGEHLDLSPHRLVRVRLAESEDLFSEWRAS
jgi:6-pyruvoyltetrahydropterin/6-carboxytetrahydropterin synthase